MASLSTQTSSSVPVITSPSQPDEPLRSAHIATNIGGLSTRLRFCKTSDGAHLAYVVIGPTDHQASSGNANKRKSKMRSTRSVTTPVVMLPALGMLKEDWGEFAFELSKNRQVLLLDYRGLGDSLMPNQPLPLGEDGAFIASSSIFNFNPSKQVDDYYESTRTTKLPRLANDVLEIIRDCFWSREAYGGKAWKRFNLLGHGMGGAVAQTMSLVLMPSSPMADPQYTSEFDPNDPRKEGMGIEHLVLLGASARAVNQGYGGGVFEALSKDDIGEAGALMATAPEDKKILSEIWRTGRRPRIMIGERASKRAGRRASE